MLRVTALELPAAWEEPESACAAVAHALAGPATDLVLLPELALTGYVSPAGDFDVSAWAEAPGGPHARALAELARRCGVWLAGPLVEREAGRCYNTLALFDPAGAPRLRYRKRHPWYPETWATAGAAAAPVIEIGGCRVSAAICFDVHFLADEAADTLLRSDVLLFPSAWVEDHDSRPAILRGLAERFGIAIVNANWGPGVPRIAGQGGSRIVDRNGRTLAHCPAGQVRIDASL
jgi:predicted amidohydrolase